MPKIINSNLTGPIEGTGPPEAKRCTGVSKTIAKRKILLKFLDRDKPGNLNIYKDLKRLVNKLTSRQIINNFEVLFEIYVAF
jgi:hypothetical protein